MSKKMDKLFLGVLEDMGKLLERHNERISAIEGFLTGAPPKVAEPPVRDRSEHMLPVQHVEAQHLQKGDVEGGNKRVVKNVTKLYEITYDDGTRILRGPTQWHYIECRDKETKQ